MKSHKNYSHFRGWVNQLWQEACHERDGYGEPCIDSEKYFNKYKWWLKREYKHQHGEKK